MGGGEIPGLSWHPEQMPRPMRSHRRSRLARRLHHRHVPVGGQRASVRRIARAAPRLRPRHLPPGSGGGQEGRDGGLPGDPPPLARFDRRPGGVGRRTHEDRREVGGRCWKMGPAATGSTRATRAEAELEAQRVQLRLAEHYITRLSEDYHQLSRSNSWRMDQPLRARGPNRSPRTRRPASSAYRALGDGVVPPRSELRAGPLPARPTRPQLRPLRHPSVSRASLLQRAPDPLAGEDRGRPAAAIATWPPRGRRPANSASRAAPPPVAPGEFGRRC